MAKELQQLKRMISSVPGVVQPIPEVSPTSHKILIFTPVIADTEVPKRFQMPNMKPCDGTTDPEEHVAQYREALSIPNIDMETAVEAFKNRLKEDSHFYEDLVMTPCKRMDEDLGDKARWLRKGEKSTTWKDKSKWYAYHEDFGHITENCIALRKEINYLLGKGYLKGILGRRNERSKEKDRDPHKILEKPGCPLAEAKVINVIFGGSDICSTSYSAAKRHTKVSKTKKEKGPQKNTSITNEKVITFDEADREDIHDPHNDGLVITLYIVNHFFIRILVDRGYSVNIILLDTLKRMKISESEIVRRSSVLIELNCETKHTVNEIKLPIYVEGVNSMQCFIVIDTLSSYNVILGRPWIHEMKAVPLTYHRCVKMPTPWGTMKITGDHQESKECYKSSIKSLTIP
ncbi:uncharacterized protein LOC111906037 [Lactuca sativa]|uniref:uncharacterized protein LOC111906037 n=1 Tax=Lactuca sativa TaxID=4236 RepID=UPI000CD9C8BA|nr:uncharacterized protein LOC111906037 [Lactuca sativa]